MNKPESISSKNALQLDRYIPALITLTSNKLSSGSSLCYRKHFNIGVMEWRILAVLKIEVDISAHRISQNIGADKAAVSRTLKQLEKNEFVSFTKDQADARSSLIRLTPKGEALHDKVLKVAIEREKIFLSGISQEEQNIFLKLLHKMNENIIATNAYEPVDDVFENKGEL